MASNESSPEITLEVFRGDTLIKRAALAEPSITIGSGASAMLRVEDPALAELHAVINVEDDGSLTLLDLGSETGIQVDGERVLDAKLSSGLGFTVGDLRILVSIDGDEVAEIAEELSDDVTQETPELDEDDDEDGLGKPLITQDEVDAEEDAFAKITEDVMAFVMRAGTATSTAGVNIKRPKVL